MTSTGRDKTLRGKILARVCSIPEGRVATADRLAASLGVAAPLVQTVLSHLSEDEREIVPWQRVAFLDFVRLETLKERDREPSPPERSRPPWRGMKPRP